MEELDFLHELCLTALYSSRLVRFAAVLDNNGRLITAEYRKSIQNWRTGSISENNHYSHDQNYLFHEDYVLPAIKKTRFSLNSEKEGQQQQQEVDIHFEIIEIDDNISLAVAPLNETRNKYLCIYIESSAPNQDIISKLRNALI